MIAKRWKCAAYYISVLVLINLLYTLTACTPDTQQNANKDPQPSATIAPSIEPTSNSVVPPSSGPAPSYDEIYRTMRKLAKYDELPDGPEVNDDGLVDDEIRKAVENHEASLVGRRATDWVGWLRDVGQARVGQPDRGFNLGVDMEDPGTAAFIPQRVLLRNVAIQQLETIIPKQELQELYDISPSPQPMIMFSGTILNVSYTGEVELGNVTLQQITTKPESTLPSRWAQLFSR